MSGTPRTSKRSRTTLSASAAGSAPPTPASDVASSSSGPRDIVATLAEVGRANEDRVSAEISRLQKEQKRVRDERKRVSQELRNAQKRKQRLKHRARLLSSEDLMTVIAMRETDGVVRRVAETAAAPAVATSAEPVAAETVEERRDTSVSPELENEERET